MGKNKEWARGQLEYYIKAVGIPFNSCTQGMIDAYKNVEHIINQLDEPEVTEEQVWEKIAEYYPGSPIGMKNSFEHFYYGGHLKKKSVKPVIPQFVADWIEIEKAGYIDKYVILERFMCDYNAVELPNDLYNYYDNNKGNSRDKVINAILNGYEVEKEKRYYIIDKTNNSTLMTFELSDVVGEEIIEFVYGYSENETIHFNSKEKAELIAHFVGESLEVEEVTE